MNTTDTHRADRIPVDSKALEDMISKAGELKSRVVDEKTLWFDKHTCWPMFIFRFVGSAVITLGAVLPAISSLPPDSMHMTQGSKNLLVSVTSVILAVLTGLSTFYGWEKTWSSRKLTKQALQAMAAKWEVEILNAMRLDDPLKHIYEATDELLAKANALVMQETEGFVNTLQMPARDNTPGVDSKRTR